MLVKTHQDGRQRTGLRIGEANAKRYFSKRILSIELQLDDLRIECTLEPDFWQGRPEIHDGRLSQWLEFKAGRDTGRETLFFTLVPSGPGAFVLRPPTKLHNDAFGAEISKGRKAGSEPIPPRRQAPSVHQLSVA